MKYLICGLPECIKREEALGNFELACELIDKLLKKDVPIELKKRLEYEKERIKRLKLEYPYDKKEALQLLSREIKDFKSKEFDKWIQEGLIDYLVIEGELKFPRRFVANLFFLDKELEARRKKIDKTREEMRELLNKRIDEILETGKVKKYKIRAKIEVELNFEPKEKIKCWLPFPRVGNQVESAKLVSASHKYYLAKENAPQRTIYFEEIDKKFFVEFEYVIRESFTKVNPDELSFTVPRSCKKYLQEEPPHIVFTPYIRRLASSIVGNETHPYFKAKRIYDWITLNVNYTFVREYSTYENLSEYCLTNLQGDCGVQALAFITLLRAVGVPAKWQSGWYVTPKYAGPHDWAMFYCGRWFFADLSFGGRFKDKEKEHLRKFYFGNLDGWRMIANSCFGGAFDPPKKHFRSDPCDNQRGELETEKRNIYYNEFEYKIEVIKFEEMKRNSK